MKARVVKPNPRALLFNIQEEKRKGISQLFEREGISAFEISKEQCGQQIGYLAGWKGFFENDDDFSLELTDECVVFCSVENARLNRIINQMREKGLGVELKAVATASNQSWRLCELLCEIKKEHEQMHKRN